MGDIKGVRADRLHVLFSWHWSNIASPYTVVFRHTELLVSVQSFSAITDGPARRVALHPRTALYTNVDAKCVTLATVVCRTKLTSVILEIREFPQNTGTTLQDKPTACYVPFSRFDTTPLQVVTDIQTDRHGATADTALVNEETLPRFSGDIADDINFVCA